MNLDVLEKYLVVLKAKNELRHAQGVSHSVHDYGINTYLKKYLVGSI